MTSWPQVLGELVARRDLTREQAAWALDQVMAGEAGPARLAGLLVGLAAKGATVAEVTGMADAMLRHAVPIEVPGPAVDVVGTGGDHHDTVNISTMAALVVAGAGVRVVKHGNRAASSACGSADVLEALGVRLDLPPQRVAEVALEAGITFCFARTFHPAMRHAGPVRSELGVPTVFNLLGPLTNPARPTAAAVGVADPRAAELIAGVFADRPGATLVARGEDGLDELSVTAPTRVWVAAAGKVESVLIDATDLGLPRSTMADLRGGDAAVNAEVVRQTLAGKTGPVRDAVLLNAAAALVAAEAAQALVAAEAAQAGEHAALRAADLQDRLRAALTRAAAAVDDGAAAAVLERWVGATAG